MMAKHWTHFLPEAGAIRLDGDEITTIENAIRTHKAALKSLEQSRRAKEDAIYKRALREWTAQEVVDARLACITQVEG